MSVTEIPDLDKDTFIELDEYRQDLIDDRRLRHRGANIYDAVAGRVNPRGLHAQQPFASQYRDTTSAGARTLRPEELLYRRKNNPEDSIESTSYFAHENLSSDRPLPSSELLETIHAYAADYYQYATADNGKDDHQTLDETALLALGILIEEMAKEQLGETGDLALVEGRELSEEEEAGEQTGVESDTTSQSAAQPVRRKRANSNIRKRSKRRKLARSASATTDFDTEFDE